MSRSDQLMDLLASRATEGLSDEEARELDRALAEQTDLKADEFELAAAALDLAFEAATVAEEPMPEHLRRRVLQAAEDQLPTERTTVDSPSLRPQPRASLLDPRFLGWYAAAAMLILALWAPWSARPEPTPAAPSVAEQREMLIGNAEDVIQVAWATPEIAEYAQVKGDVVWSNRQQSGFMRLRDLPANRSAVEQYQLWIVDPTRDQRPIDGGVFDIPAGVDEIIVPIDAKLQINNPQVFAITLEQAGGVVVSDGPLLVIASAQT